MATLSNFDHMDRVIESGDRAPWKVNGGSMSCRIYQPDDYPYDTGRMSETERNQMLDQVKGNESEYRVIFSYSTPIAWDCPDGHLHVTSSRYSTSTTRHTNRVLRTFGAVRNEQA